MPNLKVKIITIYLMLYYYYFFLISKHHFLNGGNAHLINEYKNYLNDFLNLKEKPINNDDSLIIEEKKNILQIISNIIKKNISYIKKIVYTTRANFGNILICLNKVIFFCEILGCKEIFLPKKEFWFINNTIILKDLNITINPIDDFQLQHFENKAYINSDTVYLDFYDIIIYFYKIKSKLRIHLLKDEIVNNLPKLNVSKNDLYIHIRSGDIFKNNIHKPYAQPPLCFYISIFKNFNFSTIYLISQDKYNPTIDKIMTKFKNIIYLNNNLEYDLSCLMNSYNLVASISSFLNTIIILNSKLENLWEYNIYQMFEKIVQYHYDLFEFPNNFTIYRMEASKYYKNKMYVWKNNKIQRKLMIKEKCINSFMIVRNRF